MRRIIPLFLYALISFLIVSCQQRMQSESGLYNVTLQKNIKVPVNGYWTWGKGNPYACKKDLRIYIHPMDVSLIMKKDPEAAPVMAIQMQDYMVQAIAAAINDANAAKKQFEDEISGARTKATEIIKSATDTATARSEEILSDAKEKADGMVSRAKIEIALEEKKSRQEIKREIAEVSTAIAEKILEREINADDHKDIIDNALKNLGGADE